MWILPKQLICRFAQDTEALTLDSSECSQTCAQSLMRRSKPSPAKTYLREWKAGNLMRLRSGAISKPSLGQSFLGWWTCSLAATRVSHLVQQASEPEQTTQDTSGRLFQPELLFCDQVSVSLKTSKDISRWGCPTSSKTWDAWVIEQRGAYSVRLNAARLTSAKECSSWPTATTRDWKDTGDMSQSMIRKDGKERMDTLGRVVQANHSTHGSRPESWATPSAFDGQRPTETIEEWKIRNAKKKEQNPNLGTLHKPLTVQVTEQKNRPESWATPRVGGEEKAETRIARGKDVGLHGQVKSMENGMKLNSRWVETLMGLPVGWTMPSCASPVTIAQTSCACLATESSQQQQP